MITLAGALAGCASATRGWTEQIAINTTPEGVNARIDGGDQHECVTPCTVTVRRNADVTVHLNKPGYRPETVALTKEVSVGGAAGFAGNIIAGGAVGMVVDAASGATLEVGSALASPQMMFAGSSELIVDNAALFGTNVGTTSYNGPNLQDFAGGDTIDLKSFSFGGAGSNYDPTTSLLQLTNGSSQIATLDFTSLGSGTFHLTSDGGAGTLITHA